MLDLIVVGAGYWGAAVCFEARQRGWKVLCLDDNDPRSGSRAASGVADPRAYQSPIFARYWPREWSKADLDDSFAWLVDRGGEPTKEGFWNQFKGTAPREGADCVYLDEPSILTRLAFPRRRVEISAGSIGREVSVEGIPSRRLVVTAGYRTDEVLRAIGLPVIGVGALYGRGIHAQGIPTLPLPVSVMIRPYVKHTTRKWGDGSYRVGDTAEEIPDDRKLEALRRVGELTLNNYHELSIVEGYRPVFSKFLVEKAASNVVVATGGHRLGLGLAGLVGKKVVEMLQ